MSKKTIEQLARSLAVNPRLVSKTARKELGLPQGSARDPNYSLTPHQCKRIADVLSHGSSSQDRDPETALKAVADDAPEQSEPSLLLRPDPTSDRSEFEFGKLTHGLWVHPDVPQDVQGIPDIRKRLGIVLQHLGAHGRTTIVKGCHGQHNRGWLRSPLGGNGGNQYYLWWAPQGGRPTQGLDLPAQDILVQAVRHHDDHTPLTAGVLDEYLPFQQDEIDDEGLIGRPWTSEQLEFVESEDPVRLVLGRPGSGKTTVLWKAIEARSNQAVLYLTWSRELTRHAEEHFAAFAPADVRVLATDFTSFLGELRREDIPRRTLAESQAAFGALIARLGPHELGPWAGREAALHAEVRAFLLGRALPGDADCLAAGDVVRLSDGAYRGRRGGRGGVGKRAAGALLRVLAVVEQESSLAAIFPELAAAAQAIECLRADELPEEFLDFDRVVVDEVQDLTLLEIAVIVEYCRAVARNRGHAPWLLVAGDDGQTVRPSGFDWGPTKDLLARRVATPRRFHLEENLRCPAQIAEVVERASASYVDLEKERRPTKQGRHTGGQHVNAQLIHVATDAVAAAVHLLDDLDEVEGLVVVSPSDRVADWIPERLREMVLTPAQTKGLEYQSVCLLEPGRHLLELQSESPNAKAAELEQHLRRTTIDQIRVSLSRATESLVFLDVEATEPERRLSANLLQDPARFDPDDLLEHFTDADVSVAERVLARTRDARALVEDQPRRAWRRAHQAVRLLGLPGVPNGVSEQTVRDEAWRTLLATAARLLVDGVPKDLQRVDLLEASSEALGELDIEDAKDAIGRFGAWSESRSGSPFEMLEAILGLDGDPQWLRAALVPVAQELRRGIEEGSLDPVRARLFRGEVTGWLGLCGYAGDQGEESRRLRGQAVDTLLGAGDPSAAEVVLETVEPPDLHRASKVWEAQGRFEKAAGAFERLGHSAHALRNWREAGRWDAALRLAEGSERDDLMWLRELEQMGGRRPVDHKKRLTKGERQRLGDLLDSIKEGAVSPRQRVDK